MFYNWVHKALRKGKVLKSKTIISIMAFYVAVFSLLIWGINSLAQHSFTSTPQVDLGYEIHQGSFNVSAVAVRASSPWV